MILGCDYYNGVPGLGIVNADKFIGNNLNLKTIQELSLKLNEKIQIDLPYIRQAFETFQQHIVFDTITQKQIRLNEYNNDCKIRCPICGDDKFFHAEALDHAQGNIGRRDNLSIRMPVNRQTYQNTGAEAGSS